MGPGQDVISGPTQSAATGISATNGNTTQPLYLYATIQSGSGGGAAQIGLLNQATIYIVQPANLNQAVVQFESPAYMVSQYPDSYNTATLSVSRSGNLTQTTQVSYVTTPETAQAGVDYQTASGYLIFNPGETEKSITVTINPSSAVTGQLSFRVDLSNLQPSNSGTFGTTKAEVTISPYPQANTVSFATSGLSVSRPSNIIKYTGSVATGTTVATGTVSVGVLLDRGLGDPSQAVTVQVYSTPGTALGLSPTAPLTFGYDFISIPQSGTATVPTTYVTFGPYETFKSVPVAILSSTAIQGSLSFDLHLVNPTNANLGSQADTTIQINGNAYGEVQFTTTSYIVSEADGTVGLTVALNRNGDPSSTVSVNYAVVPGTAAASRFGGVSGGTVTFPPGISQATITVPIIDDFVVEPPQDFSVVLLPPANAYYSVGLNNSANVIITDNDGDFYVEFENSTYGNTEPGLNQTLVVPVRLRATRNGSATVPLAVDYQLIPVTAQPNVDYVDTTATSHTITFAPGDSEVDLPITILSDNQSGGTKTFQILLKKNTTPLGAFTSVGRQAEAEFKIFEYDVPVNQVQFLAPEFTTMEGGPAMIIPVVRNGPYSLSAGTINVETRLTDADLNPYGDTAVPNRDFTPVQTTLTYQVYRDIYGVVYGQDTIKYLTIPILDNGMVTGDLYFTVKLTSASNLSYGSQLTARVNIRDAELGNRVQFDQNSYSVAKGGTANVIVTLNPTGNTAITNSVDYRIGSITAANGVDYYGYDGTLVFSPADFATATQGALISKTISVVTSASSLYAQSTKTFKVTLLNPSSGVVVIPPSETIVTISDTSRLVLPSVSVNVPDGAKDIIASGTQKGIFTISRAGAADLPLTVYYQVLGSGVAGPGPDQYDYVAITGTSTMTTGSITLSASQTSLDIPVVSHSNSTAQEIRSVILRVLPSSAYNVGAAVSGTVSLEPSNPPGLGVKISVNNAAPLVGKQVNYTMVVTNSVGSVDAQNVILRQNFPPWVQFVSSDRGKLVTVGTTSAGTELTIPLGTVPAGSTVTVRTVALPGAALTYESKAWIVADNLDSYFGDDSDSVRVSVQNPIIFPSVSVYGAADAYELTPLVATGSGGGYTYLGSYPGALTVTRSGDTALGLDVYYRLLTDADLGAGVASVPGRSYESIATGGYGSVSILAGTDSVTIPVMPNHDGVTTGDQVVGIQILDPAVFTSGSLTYKVGSPNIGTIKVRDADIPNVSVVATTPNASEFGPIGSGTVPSASIQLSTIYGVFTVSRGVVTSFDLPLNFNFGGTAVAGTDYNIYVDGQLSDATLLTIPAYRSKIEVAIMPIPNSNVEGNRTVTLTIQNATQPSNNGTTIQQPIAYNVLSGARTGTITIYDKETVFLSQSPSDRTAVRGGKSGSITFNRQGSGLAQGLFVVFGVSGPAKRDRDYVLYQEKTALSPRRKITSSNYICFPAGITQVKVSVDAPVSVDPMILTIKGSPYYQFASTTYRSVVNILKNGK